MSKAILFDWGGVLIDNPSNGLMNYCAKTLGVKVVAFRNIFSQYESEFQKGQILENDLWEKICSLLEINKPISHSLWKEAVEKVFTDKKEVYGLVQDLKKEKYKVGILSNTEIPTLEYFYANEYQKYFDASIFSCLEKTVKPEEKIYRVALEKLQAKPRQTIFIDDKPEYIAGAEAIGINGIVFKNFRQLKEELTARLK